MKVIYGIALALILVIRPGDAWCQHDFWQSDKDQGWVSSDWTEAAAPRMSWTLFSGIEGSKQPQDLGVNANFGGRVAANLGMLLRDDWGLGAQLGTSINATGNAVQVFERVEGTDGRFQSFTTVGIFQRLDSGWKWGLGHDFLYQDYFDRSSLSQWRGRLAFDATCRDELGLQFAVRGRSDEVNFAGIPWLLRPISYGALSWRHQWEGGAITTGWLGLAASHAEANLALGDLEPAGRQFLFGADFLAPLTRFVALYGEANFIMPADTGTVDAFLGVEWSPRGNMRHVRGLRSHPLLPLANNTSFAVDARRQ